MRKCINREFFLLYLDQHPQAIKHNFPSCLTSLFSSCFEGGVVEVKIRVDSEGTIYNNKAAE